MQSIRIWINNKIMEQTDTFNFFRIYPMKEKKN